ncbi:MAG: Na/Pi cotransporter family protein [Phycisphaerales bacterium]|nr:Na/Pi cotransporter family protein [Phycisphaerales bacterium]
MIVALLGGLGLFLLGMVLLTDGLKAMAGAALRGILTRMVAGPLSGVGWGALLTALVQSSTATTLTTVGFVSAGLLTFTQAVSVIFGANLGTTSTGWIVSQLGMKISLGGVSPPLVLVGVALRLLCRGRAAHAGTAIAGFGLLFIGIDMLQVGMSTAAARLGPDAIPSATAAGGFSARLLLVGIGFLMTVVMQSSSASMATTLAAVSSGAIGLEQAALIAIGQNIGTTPTAVAAAIGAPAAAKRTALAHVLFNVVTAAAALLLLPLMLSAVQRAAQAIGESDAPTLLAMFHTAFNLLGILILLPLIKPFARGIERLIPEHYRPPTRFLTPAVAEIGPVAQEAARRAIAQVLVEIAPVAATRLRGSNADPAALNRLSRAEEALKEVQDFIHRLGRSTQHAVEVQRQEALLHAEEHASRLVAALAEPGPWRHHGQDDAVATHTAHAPAALADAVGSLARDTDDSAADVPGAVGALAARAETTSRAIAEARRTERHAALRDVASGRLSPESAAARIDVLLWTDRAAYHLWRACHYLADPTPGKPESPHSQPRAEEPPHPSDTSATSR